MPMLPSFLGSAAPYLALLDRIIAKNGRRKRGGGARAHCVRGAARSYSASAERDGLWSEIYHTITGKPGIADPLWVVRRGPNELIDWNTQNSQRKCARTRARAVALVAVVIAAAVSSCMRIGTLLVGLFCIGTSNEM